jgi:hypothetical protein
MVSGMCYCVTSLNYMNNNFAEQGKNAKSTKMTAFFGRGNL